jgi:hypothetical protein
MFDFVQLTDMETYSEVRIGKNLCDAFPTRNGLKQVGVFFTAALQLCFRIFHQKGPRKSERTATEWKVSASGL